MAKEPLSITKEWVEGVLDAARLRAKMAPTVPPDEKYKAALDAVVRTVIAYMMVDPQNVVRRGMTIRGVSYIKRANIPELEAKLGGVFKVKSYDCFDLRIYCPEHATDPNVMEVDALWYD